MARSHLLTCRPYAEFVFAWVGRVEPPTARKIERLDGDLDLTITRG
jgi:hypothetical protein